MSKKYTEEDHAENLIKILEEENTCSKCPGTYGGTYLSNTCYICTKFVKIKHTQFMSVALSNPSLTSCPCNYLGEKEAIKRSWIALEEKGYLDG